MPRTLIVEGITMSADTSTAFRRSDSLGESIRNGRAVNGDRSHLTGAKLAEDILYFRRQTSMVRTGHDTLLLRKHMRILLPEQEPVHPLHGVLHLTRPH